MHVVSLRSAAGADVDDCRLNLTVDVVADHLELLSRVDDMGVADILKERKQSLRPLVIDLDLLSEDGRGHVLRVGLSQSKHALLTDVLGAVHHEALVRLDAVLDEELALEFRLGEVLNEDSVLSFKGETSDEGSDLSLLVALL